MINSESSFETESKFKEFFKSPGIMMLKPTEKIFVKKASIFPYPRAQNSDRSEPGSCENASPGGPLASRHLPQLDRAARFLKSFNQKKENAELDRKKSDLWKKDSSFRSEQLSLLERSMKLYQNVVSLKKEVQSNVRSTDSISTAKRESVLSLKGFSNHLEKRVVASCEELSRLSKKSKKSLHLESSENRCFHKKTATTYVTEDSSKPGHSFSQLFSTCFVKNQAETTPKNENTDCSSSTSAKKTQKPEKSLLKRLLGNQTEDLLGKEKPVRLCPSESHVKQKILSKISKKAEPKFLFFKNKVKKRKSKEALHFSDLQQESPTMPSRVNTCLEKILEDEREEDEENDSTLQNIKFRRSKTQQGDVFDSEAALGFARLIENYKPKHQENQSDLGYFVFKSSRK